MARGAINISVTGDYNDRDINRAIRDLERLKLPAAEHSFDARAAVLIERARELRSSR